jgi:uncharacterized membrane protein YphA (DoxX/SURF4 family)
MDALKRFFSNGIVLGILKLALGSVFVAASLGKIIDPAGFEKDVYSYVILPSYWVPAFSAAIPWIEFTAGALLVLDIFPKSSVLIIIGLLVTFIIAIYIDVNRGVEISCGCFDFLFPKESIGWNTILRDIVMLLAGIPVLLFDHNKAVLYGFMTKNKAKKKEI